ncbi:amino acid ABC transporter permease [Microvirga brassicacearum]|uniref:ABC transporter permease subunit n=1 Tax=Microvirga brassicacearum TaxID=2580413 RepID=A0A5N3P3D5_9HYPH|nr:ABC transporter permease subunit [Microvirga brassicacearum]KAB0264232.1 ABC transporter permease subunit [Microvirga brassicacearum]
MHVAPESPWRIIYNLRARAIFYQVACGAAVVLIAYFLFANASENLARQNIATGFSYLSREAGFVISQSPIAYQPSDTYVRALLVGILNTVRVSSAAAIFATVIGTLVGVGRLSSNPLLSRIAMVYVEILRNVPLLLFLFLWYAIIITALPPVRQAFQILPAVYLSNSGLVIPSITCSDELTWIALALAVGIVAAIIIARALRRSRITTGIERRVWPFVVSALMLPSLATILILRPSVMVDWPELGRFRLAGGAQLMPEFVALLLGLTLSASANVAEIVRSGIVSIRKGQWEAAASLGLRRPLSLRLVILPQALRVIIPPMTSTYLNVFKNSSLAIAIGYPDLVMVSNTTMNQTGQAIEPIALFMMVYLSLSLAISAFMNWYNARVALRG